MLVLLLSTLIGCLPKMWQAQCVENNDCSNFNLISTEPPSIKPFEISRNDTDIQVRVHKFRLEENGMKAYSEGLETCRGLHLSRDTYQIENEKLIQRIYRNYSFTKDNMVDGDYIPCGDWEPTDGQTKLFVAFPSGEEQLYIPLTSAKNEHNLPFQLLGMGILMYPDDPSLDYLASTNGTDYAFSEVLPERKGEWICPALLQLTEITARGKLEDWKLTFSTPQGLLTIPYISGDSPRLLQLKSTVQQCEPTVKSHLINIIKKSSSTYSGSYKQFEKLSKALYGKRISSRKKTRSSKTTPTVSKSTQETRTENKAMVGTYRCASSGQIAYFRIYKDGTFRLKVELQNGSASGICSGAVCEIDSIYKSAIAFTGGVEHFTIKSRSKAIILNDKTRCELR